MSEPDLNFGDREFLLSRYLDGDLDAAERRELESTLRTDPELAELLEGYRRVDRLVRSQHAPAPELDWERFAFEVRRRCATPRLQTKRPVYYRLFAPLAGAAAIALVCTAYLMYSDRSTDTGSSTTGLHAVAEVRLGGPVEFAQTNRVAVVRVYRTPPSGYRKPSPSGKSYVIAAAVAGPHEHTVLPEEAGPFF